MLEKVDPSVLGLSEERLGRITRWLELQVGEGKLAGASALVARRGKIAYQQCAGFADKEEGKVFAPETIVRIYSMTKPITTVAAMMLYEEPFPEVGNLEARGEFFYFLSFVVLILTFVSVKAIYSTRFKLILNAIRDNEDKAEAMGIQTMKYKIIGWMISAFFCGLAGGIMGGLVGYIDSTDVAFDGREMGVFMVLMAILGGKGTLWGPIIGATIFHIFKEGFWTFFLGWQYVALGVLIVVIVIYFPEGIMGWLREKYPERFGEVVDEADRKAQVELK